MRGEPVSAAEGKSAEGVGGKRIRYRIPKYHSQVCLRYTHAVVYS